MTGDEAAWLIAQIERVLNRIWRVRRQRTPASRLVIYWAALTAGPPLIGASLALSSYLVSLPLIEGAAASVGFGRLLLGLVHLAAKDPEPLVKEVATAIEKGYAADFPEPLFAILNFAKINDAPMEGEWVMEVDWVQHEYCE